MDTSLKTLRDYSKARLDILKLLRDAEIQQVVELPHIVAVGAQSVGKSSVNEVISTLKLPRGVGTCTKCPMEFRLEHSRDSPCLSVDITLRFASDEQNVPFRSNLSDLDEIRQAIADAQEHILNPTLIGREAAPSPGVSARTFSEDCVRVFAKGPNMPDLCFYDIPGVIEDVSDGQDPAQIDLIKNLVKKYAAKRNCIVLLIISCEYDLEISGVPRLIFNDSDPELMERTVGVLTKVDNISEAMRPTWLKAFHNKTRKLDNGWFAVKLPAQGDIPWEEARTQEREFFRDNEPWKSISGDDRNRLGSEQLTQHISKLLSNLVAARLPVISREITKIIDDCDAKLERLPHHTARDAYDTVLTVIDGFSADFSAHIQGIPPKPFTTDVGLVYQVKELYDTIRHGVSEHTPRFCPTDTPDIGTPPRSSLAWAHLCAEGEIVYLDTMMEYIKRAVTRELPGELPYGITPRIITHAVQSWKDVAITGFRNVKALAIDHFNALVQEHFAEYERGGLLSSVQEILDENIAHCATVTVAELKGLAEMELVPSTVLKEEYSVLRAAIYRQYQGELAPDRGLETSLFDVFEALLVNNSASIVADLSGGVISAATRNSLFDQFATSGQRGYDPTSLNSPAVDKDRHNALTVMSSAQAYLELASKRFEDVAANCIDHSFLRQLDTRVRKALRALPANTSPEMCLELIQDPTVVERRRRDMYKRNHYASVKTMLDIARRDLERDDPEIHVHAGSHQRAPDPSLPSNSESEAAYTPLSVDCSAPLDASRPPESKATTAEVDQTTAGTSFLPTTSHFPIIYPAPVVARLSNDLTAFRSADTVALERELSTGGVVVSVHSARDAVAWVEAHYDDPLLSTLRARSFEGPIAIPLSADESALVIFGSIADALVPQLAKKLAEVSGFAVMVRSIADNPLLNFQSPADVTPSQSVSGGISTGKAARLRGGAEDDEDDASIPKWEGKSHNATVDLRLKVNDDMAYDVAISSDIKFKTQSSAGTSDPAIFPPPPEVLSLVSLQVKLRRGETMLDRSFSNIGFLVHRPNSIIMCDFLDFGYERPDTKRKVTSQKSTSTTGGATFGLTGLVPSLTVTGGYTRGGGENVEVADEKPMPRCNIDYDLGKRWDPEEARKVKKDFHSYDVSWLPAMNRQKVAHEMRVEFGLGMRIRQKKLLYGPGLPQISSILRNQIVIWVHDPDLRSKSRGVLLLTSTYIPDVRTDKRLTIHETTTANLDVQWSQDPPVAEPVEVPYNAATWVSVAALNKSKKKISSTVGKFFDKLSFKSSAAAGKSSTAELPIYETVSRGWDTTNKRWKNVLWPTLDQDFRRVNNKQEGAAWKLVWSTNTGPPAPAPPALPIPTVTVSQPLIIPHKDEPRVSSASTTTADIAFTSIFDPDEAATAYTSLASSSRTDIKNSAPAP